MDDSSGHDCEQLRAVWDRNSRAQVLVAVHDTRLGPAHGGIRRWGYEDAAAAERDVVALARAMTWKCALAEVPAGGGKAVIIDRPDLDREAAYRVVGRVVEELGGAFYTGPDVNTTAEDLRVGDVLRRLDVLTVPSISWAPSQNGSSVADRSRATSAPTRRPARANTALMISSIRFASASSR